MLLYLQFFLFKFYKFDENACQPPGIVTCYVTTSGFLDYHAWFFCFMQKNRKEILSHLTWYIYNNNVVSYINFSALLIQVGVVCVAVALFYWRFWGFWVNGGLEKMGEENIFPSGCFSRPFFLRPFFLTWHLFKNVQNLQ